MCSKQGRNQWRVWGIRIPQLLKRPPQTFGIPSQTPWNNANLILAQSALKCSLTSIQETERGGKGVVVRWKGVVVRWKGGGDKVERMWW